MEHELGPLPEPFMGLHTELTHVVYNAWADQMREYALAEVRKAVAAERERCEMLCRDIARVHRYAYDGGIKSRHQEERSPYTKGMADCASQCASAIRETSSDSTPNTNQD